MDYFGRNTSFAVLCRCACADDHFLINVLPTVHVYSTLLLIGFDSAEDKHNSTDLPLPEGYDV